MLRFVCGIVLLIVSAVLFEVVLFFKSVRFAFRFVLKVYKKKKGKGRGLVYLLRNKMMRLKDRIRSKVVVWPEGCKVKYNTYKFYLDMFMLSFVFTPDELEKLLLPKGQRNMTRGDYVHRVSDWYEGQTKEAPITFMEFLDENVVGVRPHKPKDWVKYSSKFKVKSEKSEAKSEKSEAKSESKYKKDREDMKWYYKCEGGEKGYSYEEEDRRKFLWTYRHFFSIWTCVGSWSFFRKYFSNIVRPTTRTPRWYEW